MTITVFWPFPAGIFTVVMTVLGALIIYWLLKFVVSIVTGG